MLVGQINAHSWYDIWCACATSGLGPLASTIVPLLSGLESLPALPRGGLWVLSMPA